MLAAWARIAYIKLKNIAVRVRATLVRELLSLSARTDRHFQVGSGSHRNNVQPGDTAAPAPRLKFPSVNSFGRASEEGNLLAHPTVKPVAMLADAIMDCTARGDIWSMASSEADRH